MKNSESCENACEKLNSQFFYRNLCKFEPALDHVVDADLAPTLPTGPA
jgi:hypothetical protein